MIITSETRIAPLDPVLHVIVAQTLMSMLKETVTHRVANAYNAYLTPWGIIVSTACQGIMEMLWGGVGKWGVTNVSVIFWVQKILHRIAASIHAHIIAIDLRGSVTACQM